MATSPSRSARPTPLPVRKPMARARRVSLFEREIRIKLSLAAIEILFDLAEVLSEGQRQGDGYFGSTMITIDLSQAAGLVREECDAASARRVADLVARDPRVLARAREIAAREAERRAGRKLVRLDVDLSSRAQSARVFIDLDVEGDVGPARQRSRREGSL